MRLAGAGLSPTAPCAAAHRLSLVLRAPPISLLSPPGRFRARLVRIWLFPEELNLLLLWGRQAVL